MPYVYYVDNGLLFRMTVNQSMVQLVADVTSAAAAVTGHLVLLLTLVSFNDVATPFSSHCFKFHNHCLWTVGGVVDV